jgi:hypothetical protein
MDRGRGGKRRYLWVTIDAELTNLSKRMAAKIETEQGRKIYPQRFGIAEPIFANIRSQKRFDFYPPGKSQRKYPVVTVLHDP